VSLLLGGVLAWQLAHPVLYGRLAGRNRVRLTRR
jgi:hypothetical protein